MNCPMCSLPAEWHDDGECPTYRQAASYLFTPEPHDLREFSTKEATQYRITQIGTGQWCIIQTYVDASGTKRNDLAEVARTRDELLPKLAEYQHVAQAMVG
jgi:hypothetical protein